MAFVGWGSWRAEAFFEGSRPCAAEGAPCPDYSAVDRPTLWTAYTAATFTMYISIAEGYGLPAAGVDRSWHSRRSVESGSMAEIGVGVALSWSIRETSMKLPPPCGPFLQMTMHSPHSAPGPTAAAVKLGRLCRRDVALAGRRGILGWPRHAILITTREGGN